VIYRRSRCFCSCLVVVCVFFFSSLHRFGPEAIVFSSTANSLYRTLHGVIILLLLPQPVLKPAILFLLFCRREFINSVKIRWRFAGFVSVVRCKACGKNTRLVLRTPFVKITDFHTTYPPPFSQRTVFPSWVIRWAE
jgi:hypothetical protein